MGDNQITQSEIAELREMGSKATTGPWTSINTPDPGNGVAVEVVLTGEDIARIPGSAMCASTDPQKCWSRSLRKARADAALIVAARNALPELLDEIERLRQSLGNLLAIIHRDGGHYTAMHGHEKAVRDAHLIWASLIGENERLRTALKPFADEVEAWAGYSVVDYIVESCDGVDSNITVGDLLYAREVLKETGK